MTIDPRKTTNSGSFTLIGTGVVGAGYWAQNMLRAIADDTKSDLLYICDLEQKTLDPVGQRYSHAQTTDNYSVVLNDPRVEAIYVATPPQFHFELAKQALAAGKHVLVEKPMATQGHEASALIALAAENDRTLMVGHTFVFSPPVMKVKELINSGSLGEIFYVESQRVNLGKYQDSGVLWDLAPHDLSIILYWLGELPSGVNATGRSFRSKGREDVVFFNLDFPSGAIAQIHLSWLAPAKLRRTTISGSQKMVVYDDNEGAEAVKVFNHGVDLGVPTTYGEHKLSYRQGDIWIPRLDTTEPLRAEWDHFIECALTGATPRSDGLAGRSVVQIIEAAERSLGSGRREPVEINSPTLPAAQPRLRSVKNP